METAQEQKQVYQYFFWSVLLKAAISIAEIVVGLLFFFITPEALVGFVSHVSAFVLPQILSTYTDMILAAALKEFLVASALFVALYLIARGLVKALLIFGMLRNILWTYPASLCVIGALLMYQLYQIATTGSLFITGITIFDLFVMYFIWREYSILKAKRM